MLKKLLKYDIKSLSRFLILIHIPMIIFGVIGRYAGVEQLYHSRKPELIPVLSLVICIIYWSFISLFTELYVAIYIYRNLFTREGYLTLTLPVKANTQLLSKYISGTLWLLIDSVLLVLSLLIVCSVPEFIADLKSVMPETLRLFQISGKYSLGIIAIVFTVFSAFANMAFILGSISLGQCFAKSRILISVLGYCGISMLFQLLGGAIGAASSIRNIDYLEKTGHAIPNEAFIEMYLSVLFIIILLSIVLGIGCMIFSSYVFRKRVNLE